MTEVNWDSRAEVGVGLQSVIDPGDKSGLKNGLIDRIQWGRIAPWLTGRRSVLDFGCGIGRFAQRITGQGVDYCGVDASSSMIEAAKRTHSPERAKFQHAAGLPLPFDGSSFDGCLTVGVLQCLNTDDGTELRAAVAELARVLSPGGQLLMIEQASACGGVSGSVARSSTEQDYLDALAAHFEVVDIRRIRCGSMSRLSSLYFRLGSLLPWRGRIESLLAKSETSRAEKADSMSLQALTYYDVAICAVKRASV